jgi:hypothetical protein
MDIETLRRLQILALKAVEQPSWEDFYRKICRWYSKTFYTPLPQVLEMSELEVLRTYYEEKYDEIYQVKDKDNITKDMYEQMRNSILYGSVYEELLKQEELEIEKELEAIRKEYEEAEKSNKINNKQNSDTPSSSPNLIDKDLLEKEDVFNLDGE